MSSHEIFNGRDNRVFAIALVAGEAAIVLLRGHFPGGLEVGTPVALSFPQVSLRIAGKTVADDDGDVAVRLEFSETDSLVQMQPEPQGAMVSLIDGRPLNIGVCRLFVR